jgi:transcription initiation factor IIF auxiliary subunit
LPSPQPAALTVKNSSKYVGGKNPWDWTIYVDADARTLQQIQCVTYELHPTFKDRIHHRCDAEKKFAFSASGWGTFEVPVTITYRDGRSEQRTHRLVLR